MSVLRLVFSRQWILTTLIVIAGSALCVSLGLWQLDRLSQRRAFNIHYLAASALPMLKISDAPRLDLASMEYRAVQISGTYDPVNQVVLRNQYYETQPGYYLLTPLVLSDGTALLVERGWIPAAGNAASADWRQYDQPGIVTISGILRLGQTQPEMGGLPDSTLTPGKTRLDYWNIINVERIARQVPYKLLPVFVQPNADPTRAQPPYPFQPEIVIDEGPHFGYALQWFTFSALLFFGYLLVYLPRQAKTEQK